MKLRRILFWIHLAMGVVASLVILTLCVTGVLLAFQRQIVAAADSYQMTRTVIPEGALLPIEQVVSGISAQQSSAPTAITMWGDPQRPIAMEFAGQRVLFVDPYSGALVGEGSQALRVFFRIVTDWHKSLAATERLREAGRSVTGAANLTFVALMFSGAILWLPKHWSWRNVQSSLWFRRGLRGRAKEWNWHNVVAIWCLLPLLVIGMSGVVMSYRWANDLVYRMTGSPPPAARGTGEGSTRGKRVSAVRTDSATAASNQQRAATKEGAAGLSLLFRSVQQAEPRWTSITLRAGDENAPAIFIVLTGPEGRPDLRRQLTVDRTTGAVLSSEGFANFNSGRRLRAWLRFAHTGEAGGWVGQGVAGLASLGGTFLVYTGLSLAARRFLAWRARRRIGKLATNSSAEALMDRAVVPDSYVTDDSQSTFS